MSFFSVIGGALPLALRHRRRRYSIEDRQIEKMAVIRWPEPRRLKRYHARVVLGDGFTKPLDEVYPLPSRSIDPVA